MCHMDGVEYVVEESWQKEESLKSWTEGRVFVTEQVPPLAMSSPWGAVWLCGGQCSTSHGNDELWPVIYTNCHTTASFKTSALVFVTLVLQHCGEAAGAQPLTSVLGGGVIRLCPNLGLVLITEVHLSWNEEATGTLGWLAFLQGPTWQKMVCVWRTEAVASSQAGISLSPALGSSFIPSCPSGRARHGASVLTACLLEGPGLFWCYRRRESRYMVAWRCHQLFSSTGWVTAFLSQWLCGLAAPCTCGLGWSEMGKNKYFVSCQVEVIFLFWFGFNFVSYSGCLTSWEIVWVVCLFFIFLK